MLVLSIQINVSNVTTVATASVIGVKRSSVQLGQELVLTLVLSIRIDVNDVTTVTTARCYKILSATRSRTSANVSAKHLNRCQ
jgi:hypothetical protein